VLLQGYRVDLHLPDGGRPQGLAPGIDRANLDLVTPKAQPVAGEFEFRVGHRGRPSATVHPPGKEFRRHGQLGRGADLGAGVKVKGIVPVDGFRSR
jgi:hypothetical protein